MSKLAHSDADTMRAIGLRRMIDEGVIAMEEVVSSNIRRLGYWAEGAVLIVEFANGGAYAHEQFPVAQWHAFGEQESKGSFYARAVRDQYPTVKLPPAGPKIEPEPVTGLAAV